MSTLPATNTATVRASVSSVQPATVTILCPTACLHDESSGVTVVYYAGCSNMFMSHDEAYHCNWGIAGGDANSSATLNGIFFDHAISMTGRTGMNPKTKTTTTAFICGRNQAAI